MIFLATQLPREVLFSHILILAFLLILGLIIGRICERFNVPSITGYILSGIIVGTILICLGKEQIFYDLKFISSIGLGILAYEIGTRLHMKKVKPILFEVSLITILQVIFVVGFVFIGLFLAKAKLEVALILGAIALATSPATMIAISRKFRAKGHLTDALMPHIGFDDIVGVIIFSIAISYASQISSGATYGVESILVRPLLEIVCSILAGALLGFLLGLFIRIANKKSRSKNELYLEETIFSIILIVALTYADIEIFGIEFELSAILTPMFMGIFYTNMVPKDLRKEIDSAIDGFTPPFILAFFGLIGVELIVAFQEGVANLKAVLLYSAIYIVLRVVGKTLGAMVGGKICHAPKTICNYLGVCLLSQATVSLGMAQVVLNSFDKEIGQTVLIVVLISAAVFELFGPNMTQYFLKKACEIEIPS